MTKPATPTRRRSGRAPFSLMMRGNPRPVQEPTREVIIDLGQAEVIRHPGGDTPTVFEIEAIMPDGERVLLVLSDSDAAAKIADLASEAFDDRRARGR